MVGKSHERDMQDVHEPSSIAAGNKAISCYSVHLYTGRMTRKGQRNVLLITGEGLPQVHIIFFCHPPGGTSDRHRASCKCIEELGDGRYAVVCM